MSPQDMAHGSADTHRTTRSRSFLLDLASAAILLLLTLGFFWRVVIGNVYQPADGGDLVSFLFPTYRFAASQISQWTLPLWNPHLYGGAPFVSDIQAGFLYLPNLVLFLLKPDFDYGAMQWLVIGHIFWAGLGTYVLVRTLTWRGRRISRPAALLAGLAFQFSDPLLIHLGNLNLIAVLSWMPWVLAAYHRALSRRDLVWAGVAGAVFALGNYAGHAQSSLYIGLALVLYSIGWALGHLQPEGSGSPGRWWGWAGPIPRALVSLLLTAVVAFLLTAPILLPSLEMATFTERSQYSYQDTVGFSLAPTQAIGFVTPGFFGRGPALHWGLWDRAEVPYAGVATLILALAVLLIGGRKQRDWRQSVPWLLLAIFGFVTALGIYGIVHGWLTQFVPGFGLLRAPARSLSLTTLGLSVLAGFGLDELMNWGQDQLDVREGIGADSNRTILLRGALKLGTLMLLVVFTPLVYLSLLLTQSDPVIFTRASVTALAVTLAAGFWLAAWWLVEARLRNWIAGGVFAGLMIALLFFDLAATGAYTDISPRNPALSFEQPDIVNFLRSDEDLFRIDARTDIDGLWQPDTAALYGLFDVWGVANPLLLQHWNQLWESTGGRQTRLYDMLNAKYVIVRDGTPLPEGKFELAYDAPGELAVYRNVSVMPRVWLVHDARTVSGEDAALAALHEPGFDPGTSVVLLGEGAVSVRRGGAGNHRAQVSGDAAGSSYRVSYIQAPAPDTQSPVPVVTHYGSNEIILQAQADAAGYVVLSEVWYPGWRATVNGQPAPVLRANYALRAVPVPAGESSVHLWFAPAPWRWGWIAFAAGVALLLGVWGVGRWQGRQEIREVAS